MAVGQINGFWQKISKDRPWDLLSSLGKSTSVYGFAIGPHSAAKGVGEKISRFDVNSFGFSAGGKRENEGCELGERKLAISGEILWQPLVTGINCFGDKV